MLVKWKKKNGDGYGLQFVQVSIFIITDDFELVMLKEEECNSLLFILNL